tara:strand:+ start:101 stop:631 length:531 start_codon:yes stop_codon:yes gene_type:complete
MSQAQFKAELQQDLYGEDLRFGRDANSIRSQMRQKSQDAAVGRLIGAIGLPALISVFTGPMAPLTLAALSGIGSRIGSEVGERGALGQRESMESLSASLDPSDYKYRAADRLEVSDTLKAEGEGFDMSQYLQSGSDAYSSFLFSGLKMPKGDNSIYQQLFGFGPENNKSLYSILRK